MPKCKQCGARKNSEEETCSRCMAAGGDDCEMCGSARRNLNVLGICSDCFCNECGVGPKAAEGLCESCLVAKMQEEDEDDDKEHEDEDEEAKDDEEEHNEENEDEEEKERLGDKLKKHIAQTKMGQAVANTKQKAKESFDNSAVGQAMGEIKNNIGAARASLSFSPKDIEFMKELLERRITLDDIVRLWTIARKNPVGKKFIDKLNMKVKAKVIAGTMGGAALLLPPLYLVEPRCSYDFLGGLAQLLSKPHVQAAIVISTFPQGVFTVWKLQRLPGNPIVQGIIRVAIKAILKAAGKIPGKAGQAAKGNAQPAVA